MAPKKAKTEPLAPAPAPEEPMSLDDLPDLVLGVILRKLDGRDRIRLSRLYKTKRQASPSVRRLCTGPKAESGVLGPFLINCLVDEFGVMFDRFVDKKIIGVRLNPYLDGFVTSKPSLLRWVKSHARAFESFAFDTCELYPQAKRKVHHIVDFCLSVLQFLHEISFQGPISFSLGFWRCIHKARFWPPALDFMFSNFTNPIRLHFDQVFFNHPIIAQFFSELSLPKSSNVEVVLESVKGIFPNNALSLLPNLTSLTIDDAKALAKFHLSPAWTSLKTLNLHGLPPNTDLPSLFFKLSDSSCSSLRSLSLPTILERDIAQLSFLEKCPNLSSLVLTLSNNLSNPLPQLSIIYHLPKLQYLFIFYKLGHSSRGFDYPNGFSLSHNLPFKHFVCPSLSAMTLRIKKIDMQQDSKIFLKFSLPSLDHFPSLESLCLDSSLCAYESHLLDVSFDLSSADFHACPKLSHLLIQSSSGFVSLPPNLSSFPRLPVRTLSTRTLYHGGSDSLNVIQTVELGLPGAGAGLAFPADPEKALSYEQRISAEYFERCPIPDSDGRRWRSHPNEDDDDYKGPSLSDANSSFNWAWEDSETESEPDLSEDDEE